MTDRANVFHLVPPNCFFYDFQLLELKNVNMKRLSVFTFVLCVFSEKL